MRTWQFNVRKLLIWLVFVVALFGAALFILRRGFDPGDVSIELNAPQFVTVGEEAKIVAVVKNGSGSVLRDVNATLFLPEGISSEASQTQRLEPINAREQRTVEFTVPVVANARDFTVRTSVRFRAGTLSATFEKTAETSILVSAAPVKISLSFPSDISAERPFTFFIRYQSDATTILENVGVILQKPGGFSIDRARPSHTSVDSLALWDIGALRPGEESEISVTGRFAAGDPAGEFVARIGLLDDSHRSLRIIFAGTSEKQTAAREELGLTVFIQEVENPGEVIVFAGDTISIAIGYENKSNRELENVLVDLGIAHRDLDQKSIIANPSFRRSPSGSFRWDASVIPQFSQLARGASGRITFSINLANTITMNGFEDANQSFPIEVRVFAEGRTQAEHTTTAKIGTRLAVRGDIYYNDSTYVNTGPLPLRVGQTTTFTVRILVLGGTNGFRNAIVRFVLGPAVSFGETLSPKDAAVSWNEETREVVWNIGTLTAGTGILQPPRELVFRIDAAPRQQDLGGPISLIDTVVLNGEDEFTGRTSDAQLPGAGSDKLSDQGFRPTNGYVQQ
ncbi:MAG: hypothetical protein A2806_04225 [Candidatus Terrybacteria bacterium RIFCSPHIGHO2_01_FULL_48_17]|uniref:DUF11 domain-containing protein n=1 Tax=Candidatus Terrybacteria bacterium RIFCSPHIGHO2_01_FULL_48_17 TaxID=1802362 RepID=A0A1G2PMP4_9BACT|nr:MAG: hypothetical protein A2806_04225 [Candidatus Terrybacteria bacterium RIFCSPHIGHO2_01_FULL_48_17]OHA53721.1 MAG: hypothetical protein A3A30_05110 [Candidatus Terrybacteria bacterium RIFCSPLOWO2_01_FULL_48_14]